MIDEGRGLIKNHASTNTPTKESTLSAEVLRVKESVPQIKESIPQNQMQIAPREQEQVPHQRTSAILNQYRREIRKLKYSLEEEYESDNILVLEHVKRSWEKMMSEIKQTYRELSINYLVNEDIEELDAIEKQYSEAL